MQDEHSFVDAINCIAYYGITNGTGDGSTFSPNDDVTRAQMAVFIARAAKVAGVDLGDAMDEGFTDIGDIWGEAQDAINQLAGNDMIRAGGEFRPDDVITRAEMAEFLVGLLVEGAPNVTRDKDGNILLGVGGSAKEGTDWFKDARDEVTRAVDEQITALYELGVTKGASAVPGGATGSQVLVTTYLNAMIDGNQVDDGFQGTRNPQGASLVTTLPLTFDDEGKTTFSVGGSGLPDLAPAVKSDKYEYDIRIQHTPPPGDPESTDLPPLGFNYEPHDAVDRGQMAEFITRALDHTPARPEGITAQFSRGEIIVSHRDENFAPVRNTVVDLFRIDTPGVDDLAFRADGSCNEVGKMDSTATAGYTCEIDGTDPITGGDGDTRVSLGDEVDTGGTTVWVWTGDNEDKYREGDISPTKQFKFDISEDEAKEPAVAISVSTEHGGAKAQLGSSVLYTAQLVDKNGDPALGYSRGLHFVDSKSKRLPAYRANNNAPIDLSTNRPLGQFAVADGTLTPPTGTGGGGWDAAADNGAGAAIDAKDADGPVILSTEDGVNDATDIFVKVESAAEFVVVDERGATNRATVTVTDQYGDPIPGVQVRLDSVDDSNTNDAEADTTKIVPAGRYLTVGRDGSYSFGYESFIEESSTEALTATINKYDHDGDETTVELVPTADVPNAGGLETALAKAALDALVAAGRARVEWAVTATETEATPQQIRAFDTEMNTIFAGGNSDVKFVTYDSNDRFNIDRPDPDGAGPEDNPPDAAATYNEFEKALSKDTGYTLTWVIVGRGSRATNHFSLIIPAST